MLQKSNVSLQNNKLKLISKNQTYYKDTIIALATAQGVGAIAVIRLSGSKAIEVTNQLFYARKTTTDLMQVPSHSIHLGILKDSESILDEVLVSIFKNPHSYTGEDVVEISCHGSIYIQQAIIQVFIKKGIRQADAGEFTLRAFLNGKMDLSQTEAVADLIDSQSKAAKDIAIKQLRGGFSNDLKIVREKLMYFASLIELELDFSEEDVQFADRKALIQLVDESLTYIHELSQSFQLGNVIKKGIPTTIIGRPNAGKSTLLNALLNEERAIVTAIPGTTRDTLEELINIKGIQFRFIDTAGLRETDDIIEKIGVKRALEKVNLSSIYIYLFDISSVTIEEVNNDLRTLPTSIPRIVVANKTDLVADEKLAIYQKSNLDFVFISAKNDASIDLLKERLFTDLNLNSIATTPTIISSLRHYEALENTLDELKLVKTGLENGLSGDLLAIDIRQALFYIGSITGEVSTDDLLGTIFSKFCIGK